MTTTDLYLPPKDPTARPVDVARIVAYYAERQGVEPVRADYDRLGYRESVDRQRAALDVQRGGY